MKKKQIKKLAITSYTKGELDYKKVKKNIKFLNRSELKLYIKAIKNYENIKTITVFVPSIAGKKNILKDLKKIFPKKRIIFKKDESLIAGIRIIDNDIVYDTNIKNTLENLVYFFNQ